MGRGCRGRGRGCWVGRLCRRRGGGWLDGEFMWGM